MLYLKKLREPQWSSALLLLQKCDKYRRLGGVYADKYELQEQFISILENAYIYFSHHKRVHKRLTAPHHLIIAFSIHQQGHGINKLLINRSKNHSPKSWLF